MNYKVFFLSLITFLILENKNTYAQILDVPMSLGRAEDIPMRGDSLGLPNDANTPSDSLKVYTPTIKDYTFWLAEGEKQIMDTTLTIENYYKQNIYNKDLFGFQKAVNFGLPLNPLVYDADYQTSSILPAGKRYLYLAPKDVKYYNVQTPTTHFSFENGIREGQYLATLFTHSINSRFNYALTFNSLNSLGLYQRQSTDNKNFHVSVNYHTKNERYHLLTNVMSQKIQNEESAGVDETSLTAFKENNDLFSNRERMIPNLTGSNSKFDSKSFYLNHNFGLFKLRDSQDSTKVIYPIKLKHILEIEKQEFAFKESSPEEYYKSFELINEKAERLDKKYFNTLKNYAGLQYQWSENLWVDAGAVFKHQKLYFEKPNGLTNNDFTNNQFGIEGLLKLKISDKLNLVGETQFLQGTNFGTEYFLDGKVDFSPLKNYKLLAGVKLGSRKPSFNLLVNQSFYKKFNYDYLGFDNENYQTIYGTLTFAPLDLEVSAQVSNILNYTYLNKDLDVKQMGSPLNYFNVNVKKKQRFYNYFYLDAQAQYQTVTSGADILPLPNLLTRVTAYYKNNIFGQSAELIAGTSVYYYSAFKSRDFFPVLGEWHLQEDENIGNYPYVDLFLNLKVRRMRIYIRGENIGSFALPGKYLYTPRQPAKDFKIQIGINWFLFS
ncbi:putative porin [Weeksellaceae bacterium TAE3-ERU29]|nr:putative porin [Weeksellaceae bacterium TAE3-ERU29]